MLELVNNARGSVGLPELSVDPRLTSIAAGWASSMASAGDISHNPALGSQLGQGWIRLTENVGMGFSLESIHQALMESAGRARRRGLLGGLTDSSATAWCDHPAKSRGGRPVDPTLPSSEQAISAREVTVDDDMPQEVLELLAGEHVVHFLYGTGRVEKEWQGEHDGHRTRYVAVRYRRDGLVVSFPAERAAELGVRRPIAADVVPVVLDALTGGRPLDHQLFVHRKRHNEEALRSGDALLVAATVRDLHAREASSSRRLPPSEVALKRRAIQLLCGEISAARGISEEEALAEILQRLPHVVRRGRGRPRTRAAA